MIRLDLLFLLFGSLILTSKGEPLALGNGESFKFRVGWGIFGGAGEVAVDVRTETEAGLPQLHVTTSTSTRGLVRQFYLFDGEADSFFDGQDGRLLAAKANSNTGKKRTKSVAEFDYQKKEVRYTDYVSADRNKTLPLPNGNPVDLITSLILTRGWNLKPGDKKPVVVMFDDEFYDLTIAAERYEKVRTTWGEMETLVLVPLMEKNPKGMFKRGGQVRVWISQDEQHLPVKFEVVMKFGTGTAYLMEYRPPSKSSVSMLGPVPAADADHHP